MDGLHLYCVGTPDADPDADLIGLAGHPVSVIRDGTLLALVSPAPARPYKMMPRGEVLSLLATHQAVIERAMARLPVAPVKFGTTLRDVQEVRNILEKGRDHFAAALEAVAGKVELDVVGQWRSLDAALQQIATEPEISAQRAAILSRPPSETVALRIQIGQLLMARLAGVRDARAAEILAGLTPLVEGCCPHPVADDRMLLNAAFLVDRSQEDAFAGALERIDRRYADTIDFRCVGPLPAYSFVTLEIQTFEVEVIERARRVLGIGEEAGATEVRAAYRRRAHQWHPDRAMPSRAVTPQDASPLFQGLTEAYRCLAEYLEVGRSLRANDVRAAVAVKRFQWAHHAATA